MAHLTLWMCASMLMVESMMEPRFLRRSDAGTVAPLTVRHGCIWLVGEMVVLAGYHHVLRFVVYISVQVIDVDDKPDWFKECALKDAGVDGSPFRHDVSKLGALTTPTQEVTHLV